ncbi:MAG: hypothetical protein KF684_02735 [Phycisphaeraceae bacterium]|nr:hypothetical protein [Phycisphaeraceae bacterium]
MAALNQERLYNLLLPHILKEPPDEWEAVVDSSEDRSKALGDHLCKLLTDLFRTTGEKLVSGMRTTVLFKGITYECLNSPEFIDIAQQAFPHLNLFHDEYQALPETGPSEKAS